MNYDFQLIFQLPADAPPLDEIVEALGEAGCDDAIIGTGHPGRLALDFSREAEKAEDAIVSALDNVQSTVAGVKLIEAAPDYAGLTEIAEIIGVSRHALRKQVLAHQDFPRPVHCGNPTLWHPAPVLEWLGKTGKYDLEPALLDIARFNMQLNAQQQLHQAQEESYPQTAMA